MSAYCTTKHAVVGLVRSLAVGDRQDRRHRECGLPRLSPTPISCATSVAAIIGKTGKSHDEVIAQYVKDVPMARLIQPEEVAAAVLYLCSADAGAVTGTAMTVAGGEI